MLLTFERGAGQRLVFSFLLLSNSLWYCIIKLESVCFSLLLSASRSSWSPLCLTLLPSACWCPQLKSPVFDATAVSLLVSPAEAPCVWRYSRQPAGVSSWSPLCLTLLPSACWCPQLKPRVWRYSRQPAGVSSWSPLCLTLLPSACWCLQLKSPVFDATAVSLLVSPAEAPCVWRYCRQPAGVPIWSPLCLTLLPSACWCPQLKSPVFDATAVSLLVSSAEVPCVRRCCRQPAGVPSWSPQCLTLLLSACWLRTSNHDATGGSFITWQNLKNKEFFVLFIWSSAAYRNMIYYIIVINIIW